MINRARRGGWQVVALMVALSLALGGTALASDWVWGEEGPPDATSFIIRPEHLRQRYIKSYNISLSGTLTHTIIVQDAENGRPTTDYVIHGIARERKKFFENGIHSEQIRSIGWLESQRVSDQHGLCRYKKLPPLEAQFVVFAEGYLPELAEASIRADGGLTLVKLTRAGEVIGRVIRASDGQPVGGLSLSLTRAPETRPGEALDDDDASVFLPPEWDDSDPLAGGFDPISRAHTDTNVPSAPVRLPRPSSFSTQTDEQGRFVFKGLPAERYKCGLPLMAPTIGLACIRAADTALQQAPRGQASAEFDLAAYERQFNDALTSDSTLWMPPRLVPVGVKSGGKTDLGTIRLHRIPVLELDLFYETESLPLANFPFELELFKDGRSKQRTGRLCTNGEGHARIPLAGFAPGMKLAVYLPERAEKTWRLAIPELDQRPPLADFYEPLERGKAVRAILNKRREPPKALLADVKSSAALAALTPAERRDYENAMNKRRQQFLKIHAERLAHPPHPNALVVEPKLDETLRVRMVYKPQPGDLSLSLRFRDKTNGAPVAGVQGFATEDQAHTQPFLHFADFNRTWAMFSFQRPDFCAASWLLQPTGSDAGGALVPALVLSEEKQQAMAKKQPAGERLPEDARQQPQVEKNPKNENLYLFACAPGYVRQTFTIPLARVRAGEELTFALEPEASVRGRLVCADSGAPLTSATLRTMLQRAGRWDAQQEAAWRKGGKAFGQLARIELANRRQAGLNAPERQNDFTGELDTTITPDGRFELKGFSAEGAWTLIVNSSGLPVYARQLERLDPGENDLGDIPVGPPGVLRGCVRDEAGRPLAGARLYLPLLDASGEPSEKAKFEHPLTSTSATGWFSASLERMRGFDRQALWVLPPWQPEHKERDELLVDPLVAFEGVRDINRYATTTLELTLPRGATLLVELADTPERRALGAHYASFENWVPEDHLQQGERPLFALSGLEVQGLTPGRDGLTSALRLSVAEEALRPLATTTGPLTLRVEHVPPGRCLLRLDGALFGETMRPGGRPKRRPLAAVSVWSTPVACAEFTMGATTTTVRLAVSPAELRVDLAGQPDFGEREPESGEVATLLLTREGPGSTLLGLPIRRALRFWLARDRLLTAEQMTLPLVESLRVFLHETHDAQSKRRVLTSPTRLLPGLSPGAYQAQFFASPMELGLERPEPFYATELKVRPGQRGTLREHVDWQRPSVSQPPGPLPAAGE